MAATKAKVLVVDDDEEIRRLVTLVLQRDYTLFEASNSEEAIAILDHLTVLGCAEEQVSVVLLDVMMPGIDGFSLCRRIKNEFRLPVIMCTARAAQSDVRTAVSCGADDYLVKPLNLRMLIERVAKYAQVPVKQ